MSNPTSNPFTDLLNRCFLLRSAGVQPQSNGLMPFVLTASEFRDLIHYPENGSVVNSMRAVDPEPSRLISQGYIIDNYSEAAIYVMEPWETTLLALKDSKEFYNPLLPQSDRMDGHPDIDCGAEWLAI